MILGDLGGVLGGFGRILHGSWGILGDFGASWGILEGFWRVFEESCMDLGGLGGFGGDFGGIVRILGRFWGGPGGPRKS